MNTSSLKLKPHSCQTRWHISDSGLPPKAESTSPHRRRHYSSVWISCYQSCHCQEFFLPHEFRTRHWMLAVLCHPFSVSAKCMLQVRVVFSLTDDTLDVQISVNTQREQRCRGTSAVRLSLISFRVKCSRAVQHKQCSL